MLPPSGIIWLTHIQANGTLLTERLFQNIFITIIIHCNLLNIILCMTKIYHHALWVCLCFVILWIRGNNTHCNRLSLGGRFVGPLCVSVGSVDPPNTKVIKWHRPLVLLLLSAFHYQQYVHFFALWQYDLSSHLCWTKAQLFNWQTVQHVR